MLSGLSSAASALNAFQTSLDNSANNLANINTTGFKRSVVGFEDLRYAGPTNLQVGTGVKVGSISPRGFAQGPIETTGRNLDVAINGPGLLIVQQANGTLRYTRDGSLQTDSTGRLVTSAGNIVQPPITIPPNASSITIGADGTVSVIVNQATTPKVVGQIQLARFVNQEGLLSEPGNLYSETIASGPPTVGAPGTNGLAPLQQGSLEQSNVDVTQELTKLVSAQKNYAANAKSIVTQNQLIASTLGLIQ